MSWKANAAGILDLTNGYLEQLARAIGGNVDRRKNYSWFVVLDGKAPKIGELLEQQDAWIAAIVSFTNGVNAALRDQGRESLSP